MNQYKFNRKERLMVATVAMASFMGCLDGTIVNIALPTIAHHFDASISMVSWVGMVYFLVLCSLIPALGKLGDILGFGKVLISGFTLFILGSALCSTAWSLESLIFFRVLQAVGAATFPALGPAIVTAFLPPGSRGKALGLVSTLSALGIAAGPVLGGYLTAYLSWRWIFLVNVPVGILAMAAGRSSISDQQISGSRPSFDLPGSVLILFAIGGLIFGMNMGDEKGWTSPLIMGSFALFVMMAAAFFLRESRTKDPLIDLNLLRNWDFTFANLAGFLQMMVLAAAIFLFPFYLELLKGESVERVGLILTAPSLAMIIIAPLAGKLSDRLGGRSVSVGAALISVVAFLLFTRLDSWSSLPFIVLSLIIMGFSNGAFIPPNSSLIMGQAPMDQRGVASSILGTMRNAGMVVGVATFETVATSAIARHGGGVSLLHVPPEVLTTGFQAAMMAGVACCVLSSILSFLARDKEGAVTGEQVFSLS